MQHHKIWNKFSVAFLIWLGLKNLPNLKPNIVLRLAEIFV